MNDSINTTVAAVESSNATADQFILGAYYGAELGLVKDTMKIVDGMISDLNEGRDPSWVRLMAACDNGTLVEELTQPLTLKNIRVKTIDKDGQTFVEIQISKEVVDAYNVFLSKTGSIVGVIASAFKTIMKVIELSGIMEAFEKFQSVANKDK